MTDPIRIEGLREFSRDLKALDRELPKALRLALNQAAAVVVNAAKPSIPIRSGKAQRSVRPQSTRTQARISGGGNRAPYYPWLDFGGRVGRKKSVRRAFLKEGRYIYAAYFEKSASGEFQEILTKSLLDVARQAGIEVE